MMEYGKEIRLLKIRKTGIPREEHRIENAQIKIKILLKCRPLVTLKAKLDSCSHPWLKLCYEFRRKTKGWGRPL